MASVLLNLDVPDLDAAVAFYTAAFELRVGRRLGQGVVELLGAEAPLYLLHKTVAARWSSSSSVPAQASPRDYRRHWTPLHLDFVVPDLEAALARALHAGAKLEGEVGEHVWGRIALLADPFGHGLCVLEFRGRGYDELVV